MGHNALGAGQIIDQGARLVDNAISSGSMWTHEDGWMYIKPVRPDLGTWAASTQLLCARFVMMYLVARNVLDPCVAPTLTLMHGSDRA